MSFDVAYAEKACADPAARRVFLCELELRLAAAEERAAFLSREIEKSTRIREVALESRDRVLEERDRAEAEALRRALAWRDLRALLAPAAFACVADGASPESRARAEIVAAFAKGVEDIDRRYGISALKEAAATRP